MKVRVAVVHDWLVTYAGAERVLEEILLLFPHADLFAVCDFLPDTERSFLAGRKPITTFIQKLPAARKRYRSYLPLMPLAIEQLDVSGYDLVISSSHAVAKGILTGPDQLHISYVHSPMRYAWDLQHQYLRESGLDRGVKGWAARYLLHRMRLWDSRTANGVDQFVANSSFIARRIWKAYRRDSEVIYPPVDVEAIPFVRNKEEYYVTASRMVPYKRIDLVVEAFSQMPERRLIVIGDGPDWRKVERIAKNCSNIELLGYQPTPAVMEGIGRARAFVFAAEEDFGIMPVEAQACGTPVIALGRGGALETIRGLGNVEPTGLFFEDQTVENIMEAVRHFEKEMGLFKPNACRVNAERFTKERFRERLVEVVKKGRNELERIV